MDHRHDAVVLELPTFSSYTKHRTSSSNCCQNFLTRTLGRMITVCSPFLVPILPATRLASTVSAATDPPLFTPFC